MLELQQPIVPSTFDFGLPLDFFTDDQEALELAAFSEDMFTSAPDVLLDLDLLQPISSAASSCSGKDVSLPMVPLESLHQPVHYAKQADIDRTSPSPSSSGTSYRPVSDADASYASDCTDTAHCDSAQQPSRKITVSAVAKVQLPPIQRGRKCVER
jgi:hypothetical protein